MQTTTFADYHALRAELERLLPEAFGLRHFYTIPEIDATQSKAGLIAHVMGVLRPRESMHRRYTEENALQLLREAKAQRDRPREDASEQSLAQARADPTQRRMDAYKR